MFFRILALATLLGACGGRSSGDEDAFSATGELVALSGGGAGAQDACHTCHGLAGEGNSAGAPRLSGLPYGYLLKQLQDYADGRRRDEAMHPIASRLTLLERQLVSAWYASRDLPPVDRAEASLRDDAAHLWHRGDPQRGLAPCAQCHGEQGEGLGLAFPPLHDQPPAYLAEQFERWRLGRRQNDPEQIMLNVTQRLTKAERLALAEYAASLPGVSAATAQQEAPSPQTRRRDR